MTPEEFKEIRKRNFRSQTECAAWLRRNKDTVRRWECGEIQVPWVVQMLIKYLDKGIIDKEYKG
jgi:DNA-binding transcriptional regulator YiaG